MRQPAIIFDFGNVVGFFDYTRACDTIARPRGLEGATLLEAARKAGLNDLVSRFEIGKLSSEAFARECCALLSPIELSCDEFTMAWSDIFWPNESLVPLIRRLDDAGHPLVLGSNTNELHATRFRRQFDETLSHFDTLVLSYEIGHLKPSAEFYHSCADAAGCPPDRCLFIDDLPENVEGARQAGLHGLLYRDTPTLEAELQRFGIIAERSQFSSDRTGLA